MSEFAQKVEITIGRRHLIPSAEPVVVAVSGGIDSMVLLHVLHELAPSHGWRLVIAHLNHRLRGQSSNADQRLVQTTAKKLKLPCVVEQADVKGFARDHKLSIEMAARQLRHEFLARVARKARIRRIALAHHADDQVELFFLRLLRGTSLEGLAGMKWASPSPADAKISLIRPLLGCSRTEIQAYSKVFKVPFREDMSNALLDFLRNRIRHELIPLLEKDYQPALRKIIPRLMSILAEENAYITEKAREWAASNTPPFGKLPVALQRRCLQQQLLQLGYTADYEILEQLRLNPDTPIPIAPDQVLSRSQAGTVQERKLAKVAFNFHQKRVDLLARHGIVLFDGLEIAWERSSVHRNALGFVKRGSGHEVFDAEELGNEIILRHWRPGDRFQPSGMDKAVKLQDLLTNLKVPRGQRHQLLVATTAEGEIFWVEGLRIGERFKVRKNSTSLLQWRWQRA